jgi:hypothetical protein
MKPGSIMEQTFHLGAKLKRTMIPNGMFAWGMSSSKYVQLPYANNPADICTKALLGGQKRDHLMGLFLHDIVD